MYFYLSRSGSGSKHACNPADFGDVDEAAGDRSVFGVDFPDDRSVRVLFILISSWFLKLIV